MNDPQEYTPFVVLRHVITPGYRDCVAAWALAHQNSAATRTRRNLNRAVRSRVDVRGYRDSSRAPAAQLAKPVAEEMLRKNDLLLAVLHVWAETHPDLRQAVVTFAQGDDIPVVDSLSQQGFGDAWFTSEMCECANRFLRDHDQYDRDDTCLMLCLVTDRAPIPDALRDSALAQDEQEEIDVALGPKAEREDSPPPRWKDWLDELRALPLTSPEWASIAQFRQELGDLLAEKQNEVSGRKQLGDLLQTLCQMQDEWAYLELSVAGWIADAVPSDGVTPLHGIVEELLDLLRELQQARQSVPTSFAAEQERSQRIFGLAERIRKLHADAATVLGPPSDPTDPSGSDGGGPAVSHSTPPTLADKRPAEFGEADGTTAGSSKPDVLDIDVEDASESTAAPPLEHAGRASATEPTDDVSSASDAEVASSVPLSQRAAVPTPQPSPLEDQVAPTGFPSSLELWEGKPTDDASDGDGHGDREPSDEVAQPDGLLGELQGTSPAQTDPAVGEDTEGEHAGVLPAHKVAALLRDEPSAGVRWDDLLWALIFEDDLAAAYWLAESVVARGDVPAVPPWLIKAVFGARSLTIDSDSLASELFAIVQGHQWPEDDHCRALALSAAICGALLAPTSGTVGWLRAPDTMPGMHGLVSAIEEYALRGIPVRPEYLRGVAGEEQMSAAISEVSNNAKEWLYNIAPHRTIKYQRGTDLWQRLIGPVGELRDMLLPVIGDVRSDLTRVEEALADWSTPDSAWQRIREVEAQLPGLKSRPIIGNARQQLLRGVAEACDLVDDWCVLVSREQEVHERGDWLYDQVSRLRTVVARELPEVLGALAEGPERMDPTTAATGMCLRRAIQRLCGILDIPADEQCPPEWSHVVELRVASGLDEALAHRLLWLPEVPLHIDRPLVGEDPIRLAEAVRDSTAERRSVVAALAGWLDKQDYRFTKQLLDLVADPSEAQELARQEQEALAGSRAALAGLVDQANSAIEQALVDGIIADERSEYAAIVDGIHPDQVLDCGAAFAALRDVRAKLDERRRYRIQELQQLWVAAHAQLDQLHLDPDRQDRIVEFMSDALAREDSRVVEEGLARIKDAIEGGQTLSDEFAAMADASDVLQEFVTSTPALEQWLEKSGLQGVGRAIRAGQTHAGIPFGAVPTARRVEAEKAVSAWLHLKQVQRPGAQENPEHVATLMAYLGFSLERPGAASVSPQDRGPFWLHLRARMSASDLARPIPQFGHLARGQYDILCLWERPGGDTIAARFRDLGLTTRTVIVLYLGRLTARQRREVSRVCRQQELAVAILDETLLVFLAPTRDTRMRTFLSCSLPYSVLNPYTPFQAGDVPPEMFYGREIMGRELQNATGSCLLYGGRQLGKSALLRHVQRQFHRAEREQYAWIENLKLVYDPHEGKDAKHLWIVLRDGFKRMNLLSSRVHTERPDDIARHIRDCLSDQPERRVLVMLDEADQFLDADAQDDSRVVTGLDKLMLDTDRRFKVVFAGLHHVQRFHNIPNQQVGKLGAPQCVGPLEGRAAQSLVREPLDVLGYRFQDSSVVLRILSYTNYHPGLIQLFCQELLKEMIVRTEGLLPPYTIRREDVEAVYRHPYVRDRIRERFDWTLALDPRYQAIAWALIVPQMAKRDSYAEAFAPGNILELVQQWWPQGFAAVENEELLGLLDEMSGLGVLVRGVQGHYRLRSPNLVRLMGTEEDIEYRLLALAQSEAPPTPDANSHHGRLPDGPGTYSPLTFAQERALTPPRYGVGILSASEAGGLGVMPAAFRRLLPAQLSKDESFDEIPSTLSSARAVRDWLSRHESRLVGAERGVLYMRPTGRSAEALRESIEALIDFCQRHQTRVRWLRVLIVLAPQATWTWLTLPQHLRKELEDAADACTQSRPWTMNGVRQLLDQNDMLYTEDVCQEVLATTGGWHYLLEYLLDHTRRTDDPRPVLEKMRSALADAGSELATRFRPMLCLDVDPAVETLLSLLRDFPGQDIPVDLVSSDLVQCGDDLTTGDLLRAMLYLERMGCVSRSDDIFRPNSLVERLVVQQPQ